MGAGRRHAPRSSDSIGARGWRQTGKGVAAIEDNRLSPAPKASTGAKHARHCRRAGFPLIGAAAILAV